MRRDKQQRGDEEPLIRPLSISHGANAKIGKHKRFRLEFDWTGTTDPTPWLCIPAAIRFLSELLPSGLTELREHNRAMALAARAYLTNLFGTQIPVPQSMIGSLAAVVLPDHTPPIPVSKPPIGVDPLQENLFTKHNIEVPIIATSPQLAGWPKRFVRISAQIYNDPEDYRRLGKAVVEEIAAT